MGAAVQIPQYPGSSRQALSAQKQRGYAKENFEIQNTVEVGNSGRSDCAFIFTDPHINQINLLHSALVAVPHSGHFTPFGALYPIRGTFPGGDRPLA
jgi:hypothetical protein